MRLNSKEGGKGKKGISPLIGYVLLVVFAVVISSIVFQWLRTYVPAQAMECPEGVSLFLNDATFNNETRELNLTITNNGRFNINGYFINIKNDSEQDLAVIGISEFLDKEKSSSAHNFSGYVSFSLDKNSFEPQEQAIHIFNIPEEYGETYSVSIIPTRQQEYNSRERFVSCGDARVEQIIGEASEECIPDCEEKECGDNGCGGNCPPGCTGTDVCSDGICVSCTPDCSCASTTCLGETCTDPVCNTLCDGTLEPDCGERECGSAPNNCGGENACGVCESGECVEGECISAEVTLLEDGFEGGDWDANWDDNDETDWDHAIDRKKSGSYSAENYGGMFWVPGDNDLISDNLDTSDANEIQISFWYNKGNIESDDFYIQIYDGNNYDNWKDLDVYDGPDECAGSEGDNIWCIFDETITDSQYFKNNFRLKFEGTETDWGESVWIDDVKIIKS